METTILGVQDETIELSSDIRYQQPTRITEREVWEVANSLWAKKIDPSSNKVRELLGNRGSFRTIQLYLDTWRRQDIEQPALDDPLWQELSKMRKKVEQQAKSVANSQIHTVQQVCESKLLEMQELQRLAEQERDAHKHELQEQRFLLEKANVEYDELKEKFYDQEKRLVASECSKQLLEKQLQESKESIEKQLTTQAKEYQNEIEILNKQIQNNKNQFEEKLSYLLNKHEEQKSLLEKNITELLLKNSDLNFSLRHATENEARYIAKINDNGEKYKKLLKEIDNLKNEYSNLKERLHLKDKELGITQEKLKQSSLSVNELKTQNQEIQEQNICHTLKIEQLEEKISHLQQQAKNLVAVHNQ